MMAVVLSTIGLSGVLVAQGTTRGAAYVFLPLDPASPEPLGVVQATPPSDVDPMPILRRNIFDSATGALDVLPEPETTPAEEAPPPDEPLDPNAPPPPCDGSMRLVGAFVRMRNPEDSFAAITDATGQSLLYQSGMQVEDREVVAIQHNRVILRPGSGSLCSLSMFAEDEPVATPPRPVARVAPAPPTGGESPEGLNPSELDSSITQVSANEYSIERGLVDRLLANQAALMRTARVIPHEENGNVVGVKLYGIRRSSLLGRLGIQNGDMLRTINGYDMTAPDSALEAYARLRNAERITINLNRRGQDQTIDYQIR